MRNKIIRGILLGVIAVHVVCLVGQPIMFGYNDLVEFITDVWDHGQMIFLCGIVYGLVGRWRE